MDNQAVDALKEPKSADVTLAVLAHGLAIISGFLAPLLFFLFKKNMSHFLQSQVKESLNFQLTLVLSLLVYGIVNIFLDFLLISYLLYYGSVALVIYACAKNSQGINFRYPFSLKFVK